MSNVTNIFKILRQ